MISFVPLCAQHDPSSSSILIIHTNKTAVSKDFHGDINHCYISLLSSNGEEVAVTSLPVDVKKYGKIHQIVVFDGKTKLLLNNELYSVQRLIHCCSKTLDEIRTELDPSVDLKEVFPVDCQAFSRYLDRSLFTQYIERIEIMKFSEYRREIKPPENEYSFYSLRAWTANYGSGSGEGEWRSHYYMRLIDNVFVSKFGTGGIYFTSREQILDAFFPQEFTEGSFQKSFY